MTASLATALADFKAGFVGRVGADVAMLMDRTSAELAATFARANALAGGQSAPDFSLPDATGRPIRLSDALERGPVILSFYRGGWCPYCNLELRAYQRELARIRALGGDLLAISPQTPDASLSTAEKNELAYPVLSDVGSRVAAQFGIAFELPEELRELYTRLGHPLPELNGTNDWRLPVPATFVIAATGQVVLAHVDTDYRQRLEPATAIAALRTAALQVA